MKNYEFICQGLSEQEKSSLTNQSDRNNIKYFHDELLGDKFDDIPPPVLKRFKILGIMERKGNFKKKGSRTKLTDYGRELIKEVTSCGL